MIEEINELNEDFDVVFLLERSWWLEELDHLLPHLESKFVISLDRKLCTYQYSERRYGFVSVQGASVIADFVEIMNKRGVKKLIRIGTCGALQKDINLGDIIVTSAAIREEGTSSLYVLPQFPSVCDPAVLWDAYGHLSATGLKTHVGITWTTDGRYVESDEKVRFFSEHGVLNVDMESSAFLIVTWMKKIKAISVGIVVDRPVDDISSDYKGKKDYKTYKSRLSRVVGQVVLSLLEW